MKKSIRLLLLLLVVLLAANGCTFFDARTNRVPDSRDVDEQTVEALLSMEEKEYVNAEVFRVFSYPYRGFDAPQERLFAEYSSLEELLAEQCDTVYLVIYQTEEVYPENFPRGGETYISTMPYEYIKTEGGFEVNPGYEADEDSRYFVEDGLLVPAEDLIKYQRLLESLPEERRGEYVWDVVQYDVDSPYLPWLLRYPILRPSVATKQQRIVRGVITGVVVVTLAVGCIVLIRRRKKKKAAVCPAELPPQPTEPGVER